MKSLFLLFFLKQNLTFIKELTMVIFTVISHNFLVTRIDLLACCWYVVLCLICTGGFGGRGSLTVTNCISVFLTSGVEVSGQSRIWTIEEQGETTDHTTNTLSTPRARPDWVRGKCVELK